MKLSHFHFNIYYKMKSSLRRVFEASSDCKKIIIESMLQAANVRNVSPGGGGGGGGSSTTLYGSSASGRVFVR